MDPAGPPDRFRRPLGPLPASRTGYDRSRRGGEDAAEAEPEDPADAEKEEAGAEAAGSAVLRDRKSVV